MTHVARTVAVAMASIAVITGCASHPRVFRDSQVAYARPERETCGGGEDQPQLAISAVDQEGAAIKDAVAYLARMNEAGAAMWRRADERGQLTLVAPAPAAYAVTVVAEGFLPGVKAVDLRQGCLGHLSFTLRLGPMQ